MWLQLRLAIYFAFRAFETIDLNCILSLFFICKKHPHDKELNLLSITIVSHLFFNGVTQNSLHFDATRDSAANYGNGSVWI